MRAALGALNDSLDRVRDLASYISSKSGLGLSNPKVRGRHETEQCGAVVLLTGYFEAFLKDVVKAYLDAVCTTGATFSSLPDILRRTHFEAGGRILTEVARSSSKGPSGRLLGFGPINLPDVVFRLYSPTIGAPSYSILWEAFADTTANPRADVVKTMLKNLGVANVWPSIAAKVSVEIKRPVSESALIVNLDNIILIRNECAHTSVVAPIPSPSELIEMADNLGNIGIGIVCILEDAISQLTVSALASTSPTSSQGTATHVPAPSSTKT